MTYLQEKLDHVGIVALIIGTPLTAAMVRLYGRENDSVICKNLPRVFESCMWVGSEYNDHFLCAVVLLLTPGRPS